MRSRTITYLYVHVQRATYLTLSPAHDLLHTRLCPSPMLPHHSDFLEPSPCGLTLPFYPSP